MYLESTATPSGTLAPVMKRWLTPLPLRLARPIVPVLLLAQYTYLELTATPSGTLAPVMRRWLTPVPLRLARPIVLLLELAQQTYALTCAPDELLLPPLHAASKVIPAAAVARVNACRRPSRLPQDASFIRQPPGFSG